ncbi:serine/threonine-protein phosphatase [Streptomyces sp. WMMC1477]|nr:PP2C family serine/threonine-protein phosphatase [Streptomyces sp. WMMC1477]MCZ7431274.1 serine/threonine-protein phosphatase [Streptomyces sp. WMMC1477]
MPQLDQCSTCPSCAEPLEEDDRFCGGCGVNLSAPPPTAAPASSAPPVPPPTPAAPDRPDRPEGSPAPGAPPTVPPPAPPAGPPPRPPVRFDGVPEPGRAPAPAVPTPTVPDFTLAPPGPAPHGGAPAAAPGPAAAPPPASQAASPRPAPDPRTGPVAAPAATAPHSAQARCAGCGTGTFDADGYCERCGRAQPRERDHLEQELPGVAAASDRGLRHHRNEDAFAISTAALPGTRPAVVAIVCDGVSSSSRPDEASAAAADAARGAVLDALPRGVQPPHAMHEALGVAARAVAALADSGQDGDRNAPACTIVGSVVAEGLLTVGWIGDSRAYWVPEDPAAPPARLTEDDSWAAQMVAAGLMSKADAFADPRAHAITGWLGADAEDFEPHTASFRPETPGVVVVCTDGLWNYAESAWEMAEAVPADARARPLPAARHLVSHAIKGGGHDNVTVAVIPFPATAPGAGST